MVAKKKHAKFTVPNYGAKNRKGVKPRWRKQRGIDNKKRVERKGYGAVPKVGYKNSYAVRFARKDGSFELLVHSEKELLGISGDRKYAVVLAHGLSKRKKAALQKIAESKGMHVVNKAKAAAEEVKK